MPKTYAQYCILLIGGPEKLLKPGLCRNTRHRGLLLLMCDLGIRTACQLVCARAPVYTITSPVWSETHKQRLRQGMNTMRQHDKTHRGKPRRDWETGRLHLYSSFIPRWQCLQFSTFLYLSFQESRLDISICRLHPVFHKMFFPTSSS